MGYILPIQQHEYADYQRRTVPSEKSITSVEKPYKMILSSKYQELLQQELRQQQSDVHILTKEQQPDKIMESDDWYARVTGKGSYINVRV